MGWSLQPRSFFCNSCYWIDMAKSIAIAASLQGFAEFIG